MDGVKQGSTWHKRPANLWRRLHGLASGMNASQGNWCLPLQVLQRGSHNLFHLALQTAHETVSGLCTRWGGDGGGGGGRAAALAQLTLWISMQGRNCTQVEVRSRPGKISK